MHHNTKFENKIIGGLEDIIWTKINVLMPRCDLDSLLGCLTVQKPTLDIPIIFVLLFIFCPNDGLWNGG